MDFLKLTDDPLSVDDISKLVYSAKCGAVSMFVGTTRDNFEGREVKNLEYEAYEPMAYKVMKNICFTIRSKWEEVHHIAIYHRLGTVPVKEASVVIAISSPHRKDSILAVQYCIENLKAIKTIENIIGKASDFYQPLDPHLIQVNATHAEMKSRIQKYTNRKRDQINMSNIKDFINNKIVNEDSSNCDGTSCARVDAVFLKSKDSKGHLKVLRTNNEWGPQTSMNYDRKQIMKDTESSGPVSAIEERLSTAEQNLNVIKPVPSDIYNRLRAIEDKILQLESISPEYFMFWSSKNKSQDEAPVSKKIKYSSEEIWQRMKGLE